MMERLFTHRGYLFTCLILALLMAWLWQSRSQRFLAMQPSLMDLEESEVPASFAWLQQGLGKLATPAPAIRQEAFEGAETIGWSHLDSTSPLAVAAQTELARWASPGRLPLQTQTVSVSEVEGFPAMELGIEASGPELEVLAWLDHLLHAPTGVGYLTDPAVVHLSTQDEELHLRLAVRVWPAVAFLRQGLNMEVQG